MVNFSEEFSTGIPFMDTATKNFIKELNRLSDAMKDGEGRMYVMFALDFLRDYTKSHLDIERKVMIQYGFHDIDNHCEAHTEFLNEFKKIMKAYETKGADHSTPLAVQRFMSGWLLKHVSRSDKILGDYLKSQLDVSNSRR